MRSPSGIMRRRLVFGLSLSVLFVLVACNFGSPRQDTGIQHQLLLDENEDGVKNASDAPLAGANVTLIDAERNVVSSVISDAKGLVRFTEMPEGSRLIIEAGNDMRAQGNDLSCASFDSYSLCTVERVTRVLDIVNLANLATQAVDGGTFQITNENSGLCLHVPFGSLDDGVRLQQQTCFDNYTPQQWTLESAGSLYRLVNVNSGKVLEIQDASNANRAFALQNTDTAASNQRWELRARDDGYEFVASHSSKCLEIAYKNTLRGENLWQNDCDNTASQLFNFALIAGPDPDPNELPDPDPNLVCGPLTQEAEDGQLYGNFAVANQASASGGQFIRTPDGDQFPFLTDSMASPNIEDRVEYCFDVPQTGTYALKTFVAGGDDSDDSFWVRFDTDDAFQYLYGNITGQTPNPFPEFTEDFASDRQGNDPVEVELTAGDHFVTFFRRETDARLDKLELVLVSGGNPDPQPTCAGLVQEAENGAFSGAFVAQNDAAASGGQYVEVPDGNGFVSSAPNNNVAAYCFDVPTSDNYFLKATVLAADSSDDSFFVTVDDQPASAYLWDFVRNGSYTEDFLANRGGPDPVVLNLSAGEHIVKFYQREDGARLDKLELVSTTQPEPDPPANPTNFSAAAVSSSEISLSWNAVSNATSYMLERRVDGASFSQIASVSSTNYNDTGLAADTSYTYRLNAVNADGSSSGVTVAARTLVNNPFPVVLQGSTPEEETVTVSVTKPSGAVTALITMVIFDADFSNEGRLTVNGQASIDLFGSQTGSDNQTVTRTYSMPASSWNDGVNSLKFEHLRTQGFRIESLSVSFDSTPSTAALEGTWGNVQQWPLIATHMANLTDGRVLAWASYDVDRFGGQPNANFTEGVIFDPVTETFVQADNPTHDMFCAGLVTLSDGRIFAAGGGDGNNSRRKVSVFNGATWSRLADMPNPHWYGTAVVDAEDNVLVSMGASSGGKTDIYRNGSWQNMPGVNLSGIFGNNLETPDWYPYMHLSPRGTVFHSGATTTMHEINLSGIGTTTNKGSRGSAEQYRQWGSAIMMDEGKIIMIGGTPQQNNPGSLKSNVIVDINGTNPQVTRIADMAFTRTYHTTILLPNGEILVAGGNGTGVEFSDSQSRLIAEVYNSETNSWRNVAAMSVPRNYHSTGTLLQDGRVLMAGGGLCGNCSANHQDGQIYTPFYLYNNDGSLAARPNISSAPNSIGYNQTFTVNMSGAGANSIDTFFMIKFSANTHAMNTDLRRLEVDVVGQNSSSYTLRSHSNENVLTPGYYYLFALNSQGVPSVAEIIQVNN